MTLDSESSWNYIQEVLRNAEWTEEQIQNITEEQMKLVVEAINKRLRQIHRKSTKKMKKFFEQQQKIHDAYVTEIDRQYAESETGELEATQVMAAFSICKQAKESLEAQMIKELENPNQ